jgi:MFS family permease
MAAEQEPSTTGEGGSAARWASLPYRSYFLGLLVLSYMVNFTDRQLLSILLEPIKRDLQLADWQLGVLGGIAFALFYVTLGVPIAKLSDRYSRVNILSGAVALWSLATAACGLTGNFLQLLLVRIGVAVGESAGTPPSFALIADIFPPRLRATAIGIYVSGPPLGTALGLAIGGWLSQVIDWRTTFIVVGLPGLALALLIKLTLREPPRGQSERKVDIAPAPPALAVAKLLARRPAFLALATASGLAAFAGYAMQLWLPSFFIRSHGMSAAETGSWLAAINVVTGIVGGLAGGMIGDRLAVRDKRWLALVPAIGMGLAAPFSFVAFTAGSAPLALTGVTLALFCYYGWAGPVYSAAQEMVGLRMRAVTVSILLFIINLIGLGFGPPIVGAISDILHETAGAQSLRLSLLITSPMFVLSTLLYLLGALRLRSDIAKAPT